MSKNKFALLILVIISLGFCASSQAKDYKSGKTLKATLNASVDQWTGPNAQLKFKVPKKFMISTNTYEGKTTFQTFYLATKGAAPSTNFQMLKLQGTDIQQAVLNN